MDNLHNHGRYYERETKDIELLNQWTRRFNMIQRNRVRTVLIIMNHTESSRFTEYT